MRPKVRVTGDHGKVQPKGADDGGRPCRLACYAVGLHPDCGKLYDSRARHRTLAVGWQVCLAYKENRMLKLRLDIGWSGC
jgi:hypothetical protein